MGHCYSHPKAQRTLGSKHRKSVKEWRRRTRSMTCCPLGPLHTWTHSHCDDLHKPCSKSSQLKIMAWGWRDGSVRKSGSCFYTISELSPWYPYGRDTTACKFRSRRYDVLFWTPQALHAHANKQTHTHTKIKSEEFFSAWSWEGLPRSCPDHGAIGQLVAAGGGVCFLGCWSLARWPHIHVD